VSGKFSDLNQPQEISALNRALLSLLSKQNVQFGNTFYCLEKKKKRVHEDFRNGEDTVEFRDFLYTYGCSRLHWDWMHDSRMADIDATKVLRHRRQHRLVITMHPTRPPGNMY